MDWKPVNRHEHAYARSLHGLIKMLEDEIKDVTDPYEIIRRIRFLSQNNAYHKYCERLAYLMVTGINKENARTWRQAAAANSKGRQIYDALMLELKNGIIGPEIARLIHENAALIKTLPRHIAEQMTMMVRARTFEGIRASEIAAEIAAMFPEKTKANAALIARTEVSKAQTALIRARAEGMGLEWYIWRTSKDERVRSSHDHMDGVLVHWRDPPTPELLDPKKKERSYGKYHAGNTFNCRCYPEPVIDIDLIKFPCRVHINGTIKTMTKTQFIRIAA